MVMSGNWGHGASAVMTVIGVAWMRMAARPEPSLAEGQGPEKPMADVLEFPAFHLAGDFEVFAERARLLG
jgi:hypothetical protein